MTSALTTSRTPATAGTVAIPTAAAPDRRHPRPRPGTRTGYTLEVNVGGLDVLVTTTANPDGTLHEVFLHGGKHGSTLSGLLDTIATVLSVALRGGVPLQNFVDRLTGLSFIPAGMTDDPDLAAATSITDYLFRRLAADYLRPEPGM